MSRYISTSCSSENEGADESRVPSMSRMRRTIPSMPNNAGICVRNPVYPVAMPRIRPEVAALRRYEAGRDMDAVMREYGLDSIIKLASNECPYPPFEPVIKVIESYAASVNRYPDNDYFALRKALSEFLGVEHAAVWVGAGSSEVLRVMALAVGGTGTSAVFAWPSFAMYPIATAVAGAEPIPVPVDVAGSHDLEAMRSAIRDDTTIVYVCNPNNPTGTIRSAEAIEEFVRSVPDSILVIVDEAYGEFVTDPDFQSAMSLATELPNVIWTRTFSKIYGLAGLRVGYAVGHPETIAEMQKPQAPFVVTAMGEAAAIEALKHQGLVANRIAENAAERDRIQSAFAGMGVPHTPSHTNFVMTGPWENGRSVVEELIHRGVITRPIGESGIRVTIGTPQENDQLLDALREIVEALRPS